MSASEIPAAPKLTPAQIGKTCLVTGGSGYLGTALTQRLLDAGCTVHSLDIAPPRIEHPNLKAFTGDLRNFADIQGAFAGVDTVFHTAALINLLSYYRPAEKRLVYEVNCVGTANVIRAAQTHDVKAFVHTSSFNVVLNGEMNDKDESVPYVSDSRDLYSLTKAEAERLVLGADAADGMRTCALRPGGIWGSDTNSLMIRSFLESLADGKFKVMIGNGESTMDNTHIENLIDAQLLAASALRKPECPAGGQAYFITDNERENGLKWFKPLVEALGEPFPTRGVPGGLMKAVSRAMEIAHFLGGPEPALTIRGIRNLTESSYFRIDKARTELGYEPRIQRANGFDALLPAARAFFEARRGAAAA